MNRFPIQPIAIALLSEHMKEFILTFAISTVMVLTGGFLKSLDADPAKVTDYPEKPSIEIRYTDLELRLEAGFEDGLIRGSATYRFSPRHSHVEKITWLAPGIDIQGLELDGREISHQAEGDSLIILFEDQPDPEREYTLAVRYESRPVFGLHTRHNGTIFSSTLPGGVAHWLPGPVHPRAAMPVTFRVVVPREFTAVATGAFESEVTEENGNRFTFRSGRAVALSELFFAAGRFEMDESFSGTKNIRVYKENEEARAGDVQSELENAILQLRAYERFFQVEYPYPAFHVVLLSDTMWDTRPYAAGVAVIGQSNTEIVPLISRALAAQWIGIKLRPESWNEAAHIIWLQAAVAETVDDPEAELHPDPMDQIFRVPETSYDLFSTKHWQWARHYLENRANPLFSEALRSSLIEMASMEKVFSPAGFSHFLYEETGRWMDPPDISEPVPDPRYHYRVTVEEMRGSDRFSLYFHPLMDVDDRSFDIRAYFERDGMLQDREISFHATGDTIDIPVAGHVSNMWLEQTNGDYVSFEVDKPFSFWLHQLRRDDSPERRREAALALMDHASDSDLQLAVQDIINRENEVPVLTALYRLMADLTAGARGTERRFLDGISSQHREIRLVSMQALRAYTQNTQVESQIYSVIQSSDDLELVNEAIRTYRHIVDEEVFRDFAIRFLREDRQERFFTRTLLEELFEIQATGESVETAGEYLKPVYPFEFRLLAYRLLRRNAPDHGWQEDFVRDHGDDPDPRIRFIALFSISDLEPEDQGPFLESRMLVEYDIRILKKARDFASEE